MRRTLVMMAMATATLGGLAGCGTSEGGEQGAPPATDRPPSSDGSTTVDLEECRVELRTLKTAIAAWAASYEAGDGAPPFDTPYPTSEDDLVGGPDALLDRESERYDLEGDAASYPTITSADASVCPDDPGA